MSKLKALGLCGVARSGKDTFFNTVKPYLISMGYEPIRFSFADALKDDVFDFFCRSSWDQFFLPKTR